MSESNIETTQSVTHSSVVTADRGFGWVDVGITLAIVAAAVYYLYLKLWRRRSSCAECGGKSCCGTGDKVADSGEVRVPADRIGRRSS